MYICMYVYIYISLHIYIYIYIYITIGKVDYKIDYRHKLDAGPAGADHPLRPQVFVPVLVLSYLCLS